MTDKMPIPPQFPEALSKRPNERFATTLLADAPTSDYAVMKVEVPLPPEPRSSSAEPFTIVCAFQREGVWGWMNLSVQLKQQIFRHLENHGYPTGVWLALLFMTEEEFKVAGGVA